jgi:tetratricopeptide (TPR) repeat protein
MFFSLQSSQYSPFAFAGKGSEEKKQPSIFHLRVITLSTFEDAGITHAELKNSALFHLIAAQRSIGPSADSGGYLGEVDLEKVRPEIRTLVENLKVGEMSEIKELDGTFSGYFRTIDEHFRKDLEHNRQKNHLDAVEALKRNVALDPDNSNGCLALENTYGGLNRVEDTISAYKKTAKVNPANPKLYNNPTIFFTHQNRLDEATNTFRIARNYNVNDVLALTTSPPFCFVRKRNRTKPTH